MSNQQHYRALEAMYQAAPLNRFYLPEMTVKEGTAEITIDIDSKLFHSGGAVHGSVYFKELDDAAFFAANSLEQEVFVLTTSFTTYITRPISTGQMIARGRVVNRNRSQDTGNMQIRIDRFIYKRPDQTVEPYNNRENRLISCLI